MLVDNTLDRPETGDTPGGWFPKNLELLVVVVVAIAWLGWFCWSNYYFVDDFFRLSEASTTKLDWSYLSRSVYGHFVPAWRLVYFFLQRWGGFSFWPAYVLTILEGIALVTGFWRLTAALFGNRRSNLLILGWFIFSPAFTETWLWFANILHLCSSLACVIWALNGFVRYARTGRKRSLIPAWLAIVLGFGFYEKTVMILPLIPLTLLLLGVQTYGARRGLLESAKAVVRIWWIIGLFAAPAVLYFWYYFSHGYYENRTKPTVAAVVAADTAAWTHALGVSLIGGPFHWRYFVGGLATAEPRLWAVVLAGLLLSILVLITAVCRAGSWVGWLYVAVSFALSISMAIADRVRIYGHVSAFDYKYSADTLPFVLLGIGAAIAPIRDGGEWVIFREAMPASRSHQLSSGMRLSSVSQRRVVVAAAAVMIVYFVSSLASTLSYRTTWKADLSDVYWSNVTSAIRTLQRTGRPFSLYDTIVPATTNYDFPEDLLSATVTIGFKHLSFDDPSLPLYAAVLPKGNVVAAHIVPQATTTDGSAQLAGATVSGGLMCAEGAERTITMKIARPLSPGYRFLLLEYSASSPANVVVQVVSEGRVISATPEGSFSALPGTHQYLAPLAPVATQELRFTNTSTAPFCLNAADVGGLATNV
ncbi:hypothetical protein K6U06_14470 [Acidiferrimicrobium sp. IK]|uniref:hypothetical protein n=1 Tax=Acidiferrimicrobium sp. IK TaxID=2871700 RepID=UPI0021CB1156|nr:hypothetical protein [Acidiferrimicrobium sp. IK]MCU4185570.1 hypothetical protein [Acidiferrimicrobium sp. IK]